jgi:tetratricopeptide (TPR) repeat protein
MPVHRPWRLRAPISLLGPAVAALLCATACGGDVDARIAEAEELQKAQQVDASLVIVREVLKEQPEHPKANYLLGIALLSRGEATSAAFPLRKAAESDEFFVDANLLLARAFAATYNVEESEAAANAVLERQPENADALGVRAQARLAQNRHDDALADIDHLIRLAPDDAKLALAKGSALESARRFDEARAALATGESMEREAGDLASAATACAHRARISESAEKDVERIGTELARCATAYPTQVAALRALAEHAVAIGKPETAIEPWRAGAAQAPESIDLRLGLADQLFVSGKRDESLAEARAAAEEFDSLNAWLALATLERRANLLEEADVTLQKAEGLATDAEPIRFLRAELLVDRGKFDEAEAIAATLADQAHGAFVRGRIQLRKGEPAAALESFEKGLARWPNNAVARAEAGSAAQAVGEFDRALGHYRESVRVDATLTRAGILGAALAYSIGKYDDAITLAGHHISSRPYEGPEAFRIAIRSASAAGKDDIARALLDALAARGERGTALAEEARLVSAKSGPAAVETLLTKERKQPIDFGDAKNEEALRALLEAVIAQGRPADALAIVDRALRKSDRPAIRDLRGRILLQLGRAGEARDEFAKALAEAPDFGPAHAGLGGVALAEGDQAKALAEFETAAAAKTPDGEAGYRAAQVLLAQGDVAGAEKHLRRFVASVPDHAGASNDLAWLLASRGTELDHAVRLATRAARVAPSPESLDTLAFVQLKQGDAPAATKTLDEALAKWPGNQTLLFRLGVARKAAGDRTGAIAALRQALAGGPFADAKAAEAEIASLETGESR